MFSITGHCHFSPAELTAALPRRFFRSLWVPSSHDWETHTYIEGGTKKRPGGVISTEQRESQSEQHQEPKWGQTAASSSSSPSLSSSPLQLIRAVLSLQTVGHTAATLLVVVDHLYLETQDRQTTFNKKLGFRKKLIWCWVKMLGRKVSKRWTGQWWDDECFFGRVRCSVDEVKDVFCSYFFRVGTLSGCSLSRQGEVKGELQTITCQKNRPSAQLIAANQRIWLIHMYVIFPYFCHTLRYLKEKKPKFSSLRENEFPVSDYLKSFFGAAWR